MQTIRGGISFDVMDGSDADAPVQDVQVNGTSVLNNGVADIPLAGASTYGVAQAGNLGVYVYNGKLRIEVPTDAQVKAGNEVTKALVPQKQHQAAFYGLAKAAGDTSQSSSANAVGAYTEAAKSAISTMLNGSITVSGTTPTINALPGLRYICGECSTLTVNLPASGCVDIQFESGSTPTVLTVVPASGQTVKWANGFDPTSLDADTTYEINVADGLGVCGSW